MSKACQCDRCMSYYKENKEVVPDGWPSNTLATGIILTSSEGTKRQKTYELCDDCLQQLVDWLANRKSLYIRSQETQRLK